MAQLPEQPQLADFQAFIKTACQERGWDKRNTLEKMLFLTEEVGELAKAVRKESGSMGYHKPANTAHLEEEVVDVFNFLLDIANDFSVDLEQAFRDKWQRTATRTWENTA